MNSFEDIFRMRKMEYREELFTTNLPTLSNMTGTQPSDNTTEVTDEYDSEGAMKFCIAVILLYSIAVVGVFVMGFFRRGKKTVDQLDNQVNVFLKYIRQSREAIERKQRKESINKLVPATCFHNCNGNGSVVKNSFLTMALPLVVSENENRNDVKSALKQNKILEEEEEDDFNELSRKCQFYIPEDGDITRNNTFCDRESVV